MKNINLEEIASGDFITFADETSEKIVICLKDVKLVSQKINKTLSFNETKIAGSLFSKTQEKIACIVDLHAIILSRRNNGV